MLARENEAQVVLVSARQGLRQRPVSAASAGRCRAHATLRSSGARLDRESVTEQLVAAAQQAGWEEREARRCANDAIEFGSKIRVGPSSSRASSPSTVPRNAAVLATLDDAMALLKRAVEADDVTLLFRSTAELDVHALRTTCRAQGGPARPKAPRALGAQPFDAIQPYPR